MILMESLTKPTRPDPEEVRAQTQQLTAAIEKYAARIQEIKELTANRRGNRVEPSTKERTLLKSLHETKGSFQAALRQKQSIRDELNKANQARESLRVKVRQIKDNTKFSSVEEIDGQIKRLEEKINKTELNEKEQAECVTQIRQLVRSRETVRSLRKQLDSMQSDENLCEDLMERLKDVDAELDKWKSKEKEVSKELEQIRKQREEEEMDTSGLISEKQECWQVMVALREKKKEINDAFTERMNEYRRQEKEYRLQKRELQRKEEDERRAKRENEPEDHVIVRPAPKDIPRNNRTPERKKRETWREEEPDRRKTERHQRNVDHQYNLQQQKVAVCDELLSYLALHNPVKETTTVESKATSTASQAWLPAEAGMKVLKKSENEERDAWLLGGNRKKPKHKKPKKTAKTEKPEDKILMHSLQTLQTFNDLRVRVPDTLADVPKAIQSLEDLKLQLQTNKTTHHSTNNTDKIEHQKEDSCDLAIDQTVPLEVEGEAADVIADALTVENREQATSVMERTKSQLPATLEDLDPLESVDGEILSTDGLPTDPQAVSESPTAEMMKPEESTSEIYVHCHFTSREDAEVGVELEVSHEPVL